MRLPDPQRSRVVLIGTSEYRDAKLPGLPQVGAGLKELARVLADPADGVVLPDHCQVIADEENLPLIGRTLRAAARQAEDLLLVYFAGHGLIGGKRHDLYLALPDSEWDDPEFNSLEYDKLRGAVLDSPAKTKVIILDCCFSGRAVTDTMAGSAQLLGEIEVDGSYVLTAAARDQVALVIKGEQYTAFTGRLLHLLREGVLGGPELLSIDDVYKELRAQMTAEGLSVPHKRGTATAGLLALARNSAFAAAALPRLRARAAAALAAGEADNWDAAVSQLRGVLAELERIVGPEQADTLRARQLLAHATGGAGNPLEAAAMLQALLPEQARVMGADHPDTLASRQYLAVSLGEAGHRDEAIAILRVLLPDRRRVLGGDDEHTLRTLHMLGRNLALTGQTAEAVALLRELVAARESVLGPDHPHTVRARRDLAALLRPTA